MANVRACGACNGEGVIEDLTPWGDSRPYACRDCAGGGIVDDEWLADE